MNLKTKLPFLAVIFALSFTLSFAKSFGANEFVGQFETTLVPNTEDFEKVVFRHVSPERLRNGKSFGEDAHIAAGKLYNLQTGNYSIASVLVENEDEKPSIFVDLDGDGDFSENEKFAFEQAEKNNPYLWNATVNLPVKNSFFTHLQLFLQYFKDIQIEKMTANDRLITQSTEVLARGTVDVKGKKVLAQYAYSFEDKKINPRSGWQGVDTDEDGKVDMNALSPEAAKADDETVVFRAGQIYVSTAKVDLTKNQIVMREHQAKDYRRIELGVGKELPDLNFIDFTGKKRKISEFRGKFLLLDVWGLWCPPCRVEMPYLREAYRRFQKRNLEIVGFNTDPLPPAEVKKMLDANDMKWTQARFESILDLINKDLRIESFPTTFLISPEGKILSMSRATRDELDLRGADLLETLDEVLPK
jgi:thiol-disulfide isomerase/thioredoxin